MARQVGVADGVVPEAGGQVAVENGSNPMLHPSPLARGRPGPYSAGPQHVIGGLSRYRCSHQCSSA
jgi:hypothetical protein